MQPEKNAVKFDDSVSFEQGAFFEPATVALHGLLRVPYEGGKTVAILGGGTIVQVERRLIMGKKLYKSNKNKMLDGVCGGIAEYFNIDPTLVRLGWVVFCALGGSGVLAYIVAALIIPRDPEC